MTKIWLEVYDGKRVGTCNIIIIILRIVSTVLRAEKFARQEPLLCDPARYIINISEYLIYEMAYNIMMSCQFEVISILWMLPRVPCSI